MANLTATSSFDAVLQLETTHQAIGGAGGTMNLQAQALTNRTQYLLDQVNTKTTLTEVKTNLNATGSAPMYVCRAWVNFNGTGTVSIVASGNVSSITDNGVGDYTINLTTAMKDTNYSPILSYGQTLVAGAWKFCVKISSSESGAPTLKTATQLQVISGSTGAYDFANLYVAFFG